MQHSIENILQGDVLAAARLIRDIDDDQPGAKEALKALFPHTGKAYVVGVTGSPGVGKSTVVDQLVAHLRGQGLTVGVLAVDPTSPFSGGAILGDRVRMRGHSQDEGVFIRSLATRGQFGGLTRSTRGAMMVLDAMGKDVILVETVGVGQDEVDIARTAHTTVIVVAPGLGDDVQAIKAGILEVGDVFVVNKADRPGADNTVQELLAMVDTKAGALSGEGMWRAPVLKTVALEGLGMDELWQAAQEHRDFMAATREPYYRDRGRLNLKMDLFDLVKQEVVESLFTRLESSGRLEQYLDELMAKRLDPYTICERIMASLLKED